MADQKNKMERVEKNLYRVQHVTKLGEVSTRFYAIFRDWQKINRSFPLGDNLKRARNRLGELRRQNDGRHDFDREEKERAEAAKQRAEEKRLGVTVGEFHQKYVDEIAPVLGKRDGGMEREARLWKKLEPFFGDRPLCAIRRADWRAYRKLRGQDTIKRGGKAVGVSAVIGKELGFLRYLLNLAATEEGEDGNPVLDSVPMFQTKAERKREREEASRRVRRVTISPTDYTAILVGMERAQQRYVVCLYETGMRLNEPRRVTWAKVDFAKGLIRLDAEDVKENYPRRIPITHELREVLLELRAEQQRVPNTGGFVFTRSNGHPIKTIRTAWRLALKRGKLTNLVPHDLRRAAITRWTALGIPRDFVMAASGHKPSNVHDDYLNFTDEQMVAPFRLLMVPPAQRKMTTEVVAA